MKALLKRSLGMVLALGIAGSLVACSSESSEGKGSGGDGSVILKLWDQSVGNTDPSAKLLPQIIEKWNNEHPDIQIVRTGTTGEQYKTKVKTSIAAGEAPDLFYGMGGGSFMEPYIQSGNVLEITKYITDDLKKRMAPGMAEAIQKDGKIYTLPVYTHIANLYVNTELFEQAGAKLPTTYTELLDAVEKLKAAGITPALMGEKDRWPGMYWYDIIAMRQAGNEAVIEAFKDPAKWNSPDFVAAATKMQELAKAGAFNSSMFSMGYDEMLGAFNAGNGAMMFQANWVNAGIEDPSSATKGKVKVIPFPVFEDGKGNNTEIFGGAVDGFYISNNTQHPDEAVEFLKYLSEQLGTQGYLAGAGLPSWNTDDLDTSGLSTLDQSSAEIMKTATSFIAWWDNILPAESAEAHKNLIAQLLAGDVTPEEFCEQMAQLKPTELSL
ncbi:MULTISPECIES: extracellular solute-binding protein [Paenibacillus]|uniref:Carbohydrate ABC transporter substrate-binding protein (CUT1 family) n=1 Tax=Paenibacillus pabuli TaxID=1472 RepID=A0A855XNL8_9BACL|nr:MULTISPECIES: extracellular solute-binding protein [Paenibacillus]PWW33711.1 carbohydrate ABC transporter substrate-binding protein (CUT1 family) [Paenibacillus pabuli]PXV99981.1 raffinose/stachyose/melibiose transport system substrate-binding protein [Paenibacillus taichungensis]RAI86870.1 raffinose/stachyose/melibiose transport system substrate-binding protein [Paenibacillus pabuli]